MRDLTQSVVRLRRVTRDLKEETGLRRIAQKNGLADGLHTAIVMNMLQRCERHLKQHGMCIPFTQPLVPRVQSRRPSRCVRMPSQRLSYISVPRATECSCCRRTILLISAKSAGCLD